MLANPISDINQTEGVVIRSHPSGESDLVLKILSPDYGKISIFAKHARSNSNKKKIQGNIEILDKGIFFMKSKTIKKSMSSLHLLESYQSLKTIASFRTNLLKLSVASVLCEAFDLIIKEEQDSPLDCNQYYEAFCMGLNAMEQAENEGDLLKICFLTLKGLICIAGFLEIERAPVPNMKNLRIILDHIENCAERRLISRGELEKMVSR